MVRSEGVIFCDAMALKIGCDGLNDNADLLRLLWPWSKIFAVIQVRDAFEKAETH